MLDHIGFDVSNTKKAKEFYLAALKPFAMSFLWNGKNGWDLRWMVSRIFAGGFS
ncbi:MAG TPA: bleomycin resistance protein [Gammaproteobacteria bacterium]|nr:bleomycin resistance protein [Gammaproteobacteria bacterium]